LKQKCDMSSAALHADPAAAAAAAGELVDGAEKVVVSRSRFQELQTCATRAEFDARNVQLLLEQLAQAKFALARKEAQDDKQAEAFMEVARASDSRARELEAQCAEKLAKLEAAHNAVVAANNATIAELNKQNALLEASHAQAVAAKDAKDAAFAKLEREHAALKAEATALKTEVAAQLSAVHAVVTSSLALQIHPFRRDRRQFATLHAGPVPLAEFDRAWCTAACGKEWKVDIDPAHMRAHLTQVSGQGGYVTLRSAAPLPRRVPCAGATPQQLPSYRVIIEAYPAPEDGKDTQYCDVGFVPSHTSTDGAPVTPVVGYGIHHYGGWWFQVHSTARRSLSVGSTVHGWTQLLPRAAPGDHAAGDYAAGDRADTSTYATTDRAPAVPAGSAVELAVDYAAGTCRVAFYTPEAVAGGFVDAPYAEMEQRFVATAAEDDPTFGAIPARSVPTTAGSRVQLCPSVAATYVGVTCRFV
jgi:hypothetical protein